MKLLITGSNGQLAKEVIKESEKREYEYVAFDHKALDIIDLEKVREAVKNEKPDFVINCAAYNAVDKAEEDWKTAYLVNGIGPKNLAIACEENNCAFVHYSTDYVFDGQKDTPYTVADASNPLNQYGKSKLLGEKFVQSLSTRYFLIRVSWVFGVGNETNFAKKVLNWASKNETLKIVDDQISSPTYAVDLAKATLDLVKTGAYGLYHITSPESCSRYEWAEYILKLTGWKGNLLPAKSHEFKTAAKRPKYSFMNSFPLKKTIGYNLIGWREATERFIEEVNSEK
ncbi:dTDP-4-dehydrorhamnose reductase [Mesoaciditoga lauensis]|uniref:dTDP-4-dehydrorhamnose reductase n=1 Tax=Mesoaciditoga lauensis TaxID=1495039 RepID=UPI000564E404|nr:dTDP-4-dehydrorhamnose reductase [Mesoaciditoga lauensis]